MDRNSQVVITGAARTPTGRFLGALSSFTAPELGAIAIREAVKRSGAPAESIEEVIMGNVVSAGVGQAPARQAAIKAGLPSSIPAMTINKVCGSGLKAVMIAAQAIKAGDAEVIVAGGMESMSRIPYLVLRARTGYRLGNGELVDDILHDGLNCAFENVHMGNLAEFIANEYAITRQELDEYSLQSQHKASAATEAGKFKEEIVPIEIKERGGVKVIDKDETLRPDTSLEALAALPSAFQPGGKLTAGNSPGLCDGASALVVMSSGAASRTGARPLARITGYSSAAVEPKWIFTAPVPAIKKLLEKTGYSLRDFDLIEVNEAFSSQILSNGKDLGWDWSKVNVNGGGIALGHPIGESGARILITLIYALKDRGKRLGLAGLCLGGGGAVAMSVELV